MSDLHDSTGDGGDELRELRALGRQLGLDRPPAWDEPPDGLWARIAADAGVDAAPPQGGAAGSASSPIAEVTPIDRAARRTGRRSPLPWLLAAAAAVLVVVAASVLVTDRGGDEVQLAAADLERLGPTGTGSAQLVDQDGHLQLRVETSGLEGGDGFFEVWLIDPDVTKLVSLGPLRTDGVYDLPPGIDPEQFPIVDVSDEPIDGDPTHSGASVLRGQLTF